MTTFKIVGVYQIHPTKHSIVSAALYHQYSWLVDENGQFKDEIFWDNFQKLSLVELQAQEGVTSDLLYSIFQGDQAPYLEYFLDHTGENILPDQEVFSTDNFRLCFFLHFTDTAKPIEIDGKKYDLLPLSDLPERLKPFTHYIPVD